MKATVAIFILALGVMGCNTDSITNPTEFNNVTGNQNPIDNFDYTEYEFNITPLDTLGNCPRIHDDYFWVTLNPQNSKNAQTIRQLITTTTDPVALAKNIRINWSFVCTDTVYVRYFGIIAGLYPLVEGFSYTSGVNQYHTTAGQSFNNFAPLNSMRGDTVDVIAKMRIDDTNSQLVHGGHWKQYTRRLHLVLR